MKKSLIGLAVLGAFSAGASAQSSLTIYGIVDVGIQYNTFGVDRGTSAAPNWQQESIWGVDGGYQSGNRLGFRGSEALGGGLNAVFTLEAGFSIETGTSAQGGRLFGRQSWAGLQGGWGTVVLGRIATPSSGTGSFDQFAAIDPFAASWGLASLGSTFIPVAGLREDNSILYQTPTFGGFKAAAQYSFNVDMGETAPQGSNTSAFNLGASWGMGPFYVAVTYDVIQHADAGFARPGAGSPDQKMLQLGATWDFKIVKLAVAYADQSNISTDITVSGIGGQLGNAFVPTGIGNYDNQAYMIGVTVPIGTKVKILASFQDSDAKNVINGLAQFEPDYDVWGVGFSYELSRRTNLYVGYAQRSWDGRITQTSGVALPQAAQIFDRDQFALGIRHSF